MTLLSGPPHSTILVGAAHCFSVGDSVASYTITCGEHSLQRNDKYQVTLQVSQLSSSSSSSAFLLLLNGGVVLHNLLHLRSAII